MSWEALEWAGRQRTRACSTQVVLYVLANAADPDGVAMGWWTRDEHWWQYLMDRTRLKRASLFRIMDELERRGALALEWKLAPEGGRRRAIVKLNFQCLIEEGDGEKESTSETISEAIIDAAQPIESTRETAAENRVHVVDPIQSTTETGFYIVPDSLNPSLSQKGFPPAEPPQASKQEALQEKEASEQPPPSDEAGIKAFGEAYGIPSNRPDLVAERWNALTLAQREKAMIGARGVREYRRRNPKSAVLSQEKFLLNEATWEQYAPYAPKPVAPKVQRTFEPDGTERSEAWRAWYRIVGDPWPAARDGGRMLRDDFPPVGRGIDPDGPWPIIPIDGHHQNFAAWSERAGRRIEAEMISTGQVYTKDVPGRGPMELPIRIRGWRFPSLWPPRKHGETEATGPPAIPEMTEGDVDAFTEGF